MTTISALQFLSWCDTNDRDLGKYIFDNFCYSIVAVNPELAGADSAKLLDLLTKDYAFQISEGFIELVPIGKEEDAITYLEYNALS